MIEPNRLAAPGERAALDRVEDVVEAIDGLRIEMFAPSHAAMMDPDEHARLIAMLEAEADRSGRRALLEDVRDRVRTALTTRLARPLRFDPVGRFPMVPTRADDAALIVMSVTDTVAVAVMEDRLASDVAARLAGPGRLLLGLPPLGGSPPEGAADTLVPEPSAEDWADAALGDTRTGAYQPIPVGLRVGVATIAAATLAPLAIFVGVGRGETLTGILAALAILAVCWLVATYRVRD